MTEDAPIKVIGLIITLVAIGVASLEIPSGQVLNNLFLDDPLYLEFAAGLSKCKNKHAVTAGASSEPKRKRLEGEEEVKE